jgi:hypothetical protein
MSLLQTLIAYGFILFTAVQALPVTLDKRGMRQIPIVRQQAD